jgi:hypothetical protein
MKVPNGFGASILVLLGAAQIFRMKTTMALGLL